MAGLTWQEQQDAQKYLRQHSINQDWFASLGTDKQRSTIYGGKWESGKRVDNADADTPFERFQKRRKEIMGWGQGQGYGGYEPYDRSRLSDMMGGLLERGDPGLQPIDPSVYAPITARRSELEAQGGFKTFGEEAPWYKEQIGTERRRLEGLQGFKTFGQEKPWYSEMLKGRREEIGDYGKFKTFEEEKPWYEKGEGGGMLGRRRAEVEAINPMEMYGLAAPSIREATDEMSRNFQEEAARTGQSPAMVALMQRQGMGLAGLGASAGEAASMAYNLKQQSLADLTHMETEMGAMEMGSRRSMAVDRQYLLAELASLESSLGTAEMGERRQMQRHKDNLLMELAGMEAGMGAEEMDRRTRVESERQAALQELSQWESTLGAEEREARRKWEWDLQDKAFEIAKLDAIISMADADRRQEFEFEQQKLLSQLTEIEAMLTSGMNDNMAANYRARIPMLMQRESMDRFQKFWDEFLSDDKDDEPDLS